MKILAKTIAVVALLAVAAGPAMAGGSKSYCKSVAKQTANSQAAKKTIVGAVGGCLLGQLLFKKCGAGAAVGGVGGFAIGGSQWKQVYWQAYHDCRNS